MTAVGGPHVKAVSRPTENDASDNLKKIRREILLQPALRPKRAFEQGGNPSPATITKCNTYVRLRMHVTAYS